MSMGMPLRKRHRHCSASTSSNTSTSRSNDHEETLEKHNGAHKALTLPAMCSQSSSSSSEGMGRPKPKSAFSCGYGKGMVDGEKAERVTCLAFRSFRKRRRQYGGAEAMLETDHAAERTRSHRRNSRIVGSPLAHPCVPAPRRSPKHPSSKIRLQCGIKKSPGFDSERSLWGQRAEKRHSTVREPPHGCSDRGPPPKRRSCGNKSPVLCQQCGERTAAVEGISNPHDSQRENALLESRVQYVHSFKKENSDCVDESDTQRHRKSISDNNCYNVACLRRRHPEVDSGEYATATKGSHSQHNFLKVDRDRKRFDCYGSDSSDCCTCNHRHLLRTCGGSRIDACLLNPGHEDFTEGSHRSDTEETSLTPVQYAPMSLPEKRFIVALDFLLPFLGAKEALSVLAGVSKAVRCSVLASGVWATLVEREGFMAAVILNKQQLSLRRSKGKVLVGWVPTVLLLQQQMKKQHEMQVSKILAHEKTTIQPMKGSSCNNLLTAVAVRSVDLRLCNAEVDDGLPASLLRELALLQQLQQQHALLQAFQRQLRIRHKTQFSLRSNSHQRIYKRMCRDVSDADDEAADELPIVHYIGAQQELHAAMADTEWGISFRRWCVIRFLKGVLQALCFLHSQRVLHRNLKPDNILVALKGEPHPRVVASTSIQAIRQIKAYVSATSDVSSAVISPLEFFDAAAHKPSLKICDFAMGRMLEGKHSKLTPENPRDRERSYRESQRLAYRAPELLLLRLPLQEYGAEVDLWSVGVMLFELTCDSLPFSCNSELGYLLDVFKLLGTPTTKDEWQEIIGLDKPCRPHSPQSAAGTLQNGNHVNASYNREEVLARSPLPQSMIQDQRRAQPSIQQQQELDHEAAKELATAAVMPMMWLGMLPLWQAPRWSVILKLLQQEEHEEEICWLRTLAPKQTAKFQHRTKRLLGGSLSNQNSFEPKLPDRAEGANSVAKGKKSVAANDDNQSSDSLIATPELTEAENILLKFGRALGSTSVELLRQLLTIKKTERLTAAEALLMLRKCEEEEVRRGRLRMAAQRAAAEELLPGSSSIRVSSKDAWILHKTSACGLSDGSRAGSGRVDKLCRRCMSASSAKRCDSIDRQSGEPRNGRDRSSVRTEGNHSSNSECSNSAAACSLCKLCETRREDVLQKKAGRGCQPCLLHTTRRASRERSGNSDEERVKCVFAFFDSVNNGSESSTGARSCERRREIAECTDGEVRPPVVEAHGVTDESEDRATTTELSSFSENTSDNGSSNGESGSPTSRSHIPYIRQIRRVMWSCTTKRDLTLYQMKAWQRLILRLGSLQHTSIQEPFMRESLLKQRWHHGRDQKGCDRQRKTGQGGRRFMMLHGSTSATLGKICFPKSLWVRAERAMEPYRQMAVDLLITLWHEFQLKSQTLHFAVVYLHLALQGLLEDTAIHIGHHKLVARQIRGTFYRKSHVDRNGNNRPFSGVSPTCGYIVNQNTSRRYSLSHNTKAGSEKGRAMELESKRFDSFRSRYANSLTTQNKRVATNASSGHYASKEEQSPNCTVSKANTHTGDTANRATIAEGTADPDFDVNYECSNSNESSSSSAVAAIGETRPSVRHRWTVRRLGCFNDKGDAMNEMTQGLKLGSPLRTMDAGYNSPQRMHQNQIKGYARRCKLLSAHRLLAHVPPSVVLRRLFALSLASMKIADVFHECSQEYYKTCNVLEYSESASAALAADAFAREYAQNRRKYREMCNKRRHMRAHGIPKKRKLRSYTLETRRSSGDSTMSDEKDQSSTSPQLNLGKFLWQNTPRPPRRADPLNRVTERLSRREFMDVDDQAAWLGAPKQPLRRFRSASEPPSPTKYTNNSAFGCGFENAPLRDEAFTYALTAECDLPTLTNVPPVGSAKRCRSADCTLHFRNRPVRSYWRHTKTERLAVTSSTSSSDSADQGKHPGNGSNFEDEAFQQILEHTSRLRRSDVSTSSSSENSLANDDAMCQMMNTRSERTPGSEATVGDDLRFEMRIEISVDELLEGERSLLRELRYNLLQPTAFSILVSLWRIARGSSKIITREWRRRLKWQLQRRRDLNAQARAANNYTALELKPKCSDSTPNEVNASLDNRSRGISVQDLLCTAAQDAYNACVFDRNDIKLCKDYSELLLLLALYDVQLTKMHPLVLARIAQLQAVNMWFPHVMLHESACHQCSSCWNRNKLFKDGIVQGNPTATPPPLVFLLGSLCLPPVCALLSVPAHSEAAQDLAHDIYMAVVRFQRLTTEIKAELLKRRSPVLVRPDGLEFEGSETHTDGAANFSLLQRAEDAHRERLQTFVKSDQGYGPCCCTCDQSQTRHEGAQRKLQLDTATFGDTTKAFGMPSWVMQLLVREPRERQTLTILSESSSWWTV